MIRKFRAIIVAALLLMCSGAANASDMDILLEQLGCALKCDTMLYMPQVSPTKAVIIQTEDNEVTHVGISIFSDETKSLVNRPVCNFIERLLLRMRIISTNDAQVYLTRNKVTVKFNGISYGNSYFKSVADIIESIAEPTTFRLTRVDNNYIASFEFGTNFLEINIPAKRELIFGTDKKESDAQIEKKLRESGDNVSAVHSDVIMGQLLATDDEDIMRLPGSIFVSEQLRNDQYYTLVNGELKPVFSAKYPNQSITNLLLGIIDNDITLRIKHRAYGRYTPDIVVPLNSINRAIGDGFKVYTTTYTLRSGKMQALAIFYNEEYGYLHMLTITADAEDWFEDKPEIDADLFTNVPQHNIQNLFQTKK